MDSVFFVDSFGEVIMERHALGGAFNNKKKNRRILDLFKGELDKAASQGTVPLPVIPTPELEPDFVAILCSEREGVYFVSPLSKEIEPLLLMEFIVRIWDTFEGYFGTISEKSFKSNFVVVQYLLDEMMDGSRPFNTDPNVLTELIRPPDFVSRMINIDNPFKSILSGDVPPGFFTATPWRKSNVKYVTNEIFIDVVEEIDCTMDCNAYIDRCELWGEVRVNCRLSGMPELELEFNHPEMFIDVSFHPCVLLHPYNQYKIIKFVPPDGKFVLMNYRIKGQLKPPIHVKPKYDHSQASIFVELKGDKVENTVLTIPWDSDMILSAISVTKGTVFLNEKEECKWTLGTLDKPDPQKGITSVQCSLNASIPRDSSPTRLFNNPIHVDFNMKTTLSGLKVQNLVIKGDKYSDTNKPFKGLKTLSKAGNYYIQPSSLTSGTTRTQL